MAAARAEIAAKGGGGLSMRSVAREVAPFDDARLARQMAILAGEGVTSSGAAAVLAELAALVGIVSLELAGHLVGTADPADRIFEALVSRQVETLGLS